MICLLIATALLAISGSAMAEVDDPALACDEEHFNKWKIEMGAYYNGNETEHNIRYEIWKQNCLDIVKYNNEVNDPHAQDIYEFHDRTDAERKAILNGFDFEASKKCPKNYYNPTMKREELPENWDNHEFVTGVKSHESCKSCWTFAAAAAIEGQYAKLTGELLDFSEQEFLGSYSYLHL